MRRTIAMLVAGIFLSIVAPAAALPALEVASPAAAPRGVVVLFHGGGWSASGPAAAATTHPAARRFRRLGYATVNVDPTPGRAGIDDALAAHDEATRLFPGLDLCTYGESSGGHLALMVAAARPVDCVVAAAAPTDLPALALGGVGTRYVYDLAQTAFGTEALWELSPLRVRHQIGARQLLAYGTRDESVPPSQGRRMDGQNPRAWFVGLRPGSRPWVHGGVSLRSWSRYLRLERALVRLALG